MALRALQDVRSLEQPEGNTKAKAYCGSEILEANAFFFSVGTSQVCSCRVMALHDEEAWDWFVRKDRGEGDLSSTLSSTPRVAML